MKKSRGLFISEIVIQTGTSTLLIDVNDLSGIPLLIKSLLYKCRFLQTYLFVFKSKKLNPLFSASDKFYKPITV